MFVSSVFICVFVVVVFVDVDYGSRYRSCLYCIVVSGEYFVGFFGYCIVVRL